MNPKNIIDKSYNDDILNNRRWLMTLSWLREFNVSGSALDVGDRTCFTEILENNFGISCQNTSGDLDYFKANGKVQNIFCFEVIEHITNPLNLLEQLKKILRNEGAIYLSTPIRKPNFLRCKTHHFHEFNRNELNYLIKKSGLSMTYRLAVRKMFILLGSGQRIFHIT